jgi:hypothetical protein
MRPFRSLLIHRPDIRMPGLHIQSFALHRHLPEHALISSIWAGAGASGSRTATPGSSQEPRRPAALAPGVRQARRKSAS